MHTSVADTAFSTWYLKTVHKATEPHCVLYFNYCRYHLQGWNSGIMFNFSLTTIYFRTSIAQYIILKVSTMFTCKNQSVNVTSANSLFGPHHCDIIFSMYVIGLWLFLPTHFFLILLLSKQKLGSLLAMTSSSGST